MENKKQKNLIFSVDDFGLSEKSNRNILILAEAGKIDRVSVMPFGRMSAREIERLKNTGVKLDLHLHLERFRQDSFQNNGEHQWIGKRMLIFLKIFFGSRGSQAAKKEWDAQMQEFEKVFGRDPDGINSHEHIHFFPAYFKIALAMQKKHALPYFRFGKKGSICSGMTCKILNLLRRGNLRFIKKYLSRFPTSEYLVSFDWLSSSQELFHIAPDTESLEVVFHPERDREVEFLLKS